MRFKLLFILLMIGQGAFAQSSTTPIDTSNYYNFYQRQTGASVNWLRECDVVPIIIDELLKKGFAYYEISVGDLIKINDTTHFVVTVSFEKDDKKYGFLYEGTHGIPLQKEDRIFLTNGEKQSYVQTERGINGDFIVMKINPVPPNIFVIKETVYWYQFERNGTKEFPVSKTVAENILRQDIDHYLQSL